MERRQGVGTGVCEGGEGEEDCVAEKGGEEGGDDEELGEEVVGGVPGAAVGDTGGGYGEGRGQRRDDGEDEAGFFVREEGIEDCKLQVGEHEGFEGLCGGSDVREVWGYGGRGEHE